jgi:hypothetical protein
MAKRFPCAGCGAAIVTRHLRTGDLAKCFSCGGLTPVPADAEETDAEPEVRSHEGPLDAFWRETWRVWRSGALSDISPAFAQAASVSFGEFLGHGGDANNVPLRDLLLEYPPTLGEFLVGFQPLRRNLGFALTNERLWLYDLEARRYQCVSLGDLAGFSFTRHWSFVTASLSLSDTTGCVIEKAAGAPADAVLRWVLDRRSQPTGWAAAGVSATGEQQSEVSGAGQARTTNRVAEALGLGALAGAGAALAARVLTEGKLTLGIWIVAYVLIVSAAKNKGLATLAFIVVGSLVSVALQRLPGP